MPVTLLFVRNRTSTRRAKSGEVEYVIVIPAAVKATLLTPESDPVNWHSCIDWVDMMCDGWPGKAERDLGKPLAAKLLWAGQ